MNFKKNKDGFTLMETVVALGIAAIALSFFIAAFAPATLGIKKAARVQEAKNLVSALKAEMGVVRSTEINATGAVLAGSYLSPFDKAFQWIQLDGSAINGLILAFQYRADAQQATNVDGNYPAYTGGSGYLAAGNAQPMILQNRVCLINSALAIPPPLAPGGIDYSDNGRYAQIEGGAYVMELTQLVYDAAGSLTLHTNVGQIVDPNVHTTISANYNSVAAGGTLAFPDQYLFYQADVYFLKSVDPTYLNTINGLGSAAAFSNALGAPIYSTQLAVSR